MWSRELPLIPSSVKVIKDSASGYFLSFVVEVLRKTDNLVGIDLGIKTKASCRDALMQRPQMVKKIDALKPLKKPIEKYRKLSRSSSKKN